MSNWEIYGQTPFAGEIYGPTAQAVSAWTPPSLGSALVFWVRADKGITIGTGVSAWADQSGSGDVNKNLTQGAGSQQPTLNASDAAYNGQATLTFTASVGSVMVSGAWASPLALPETIFLVGNFDGTTTNQDMADGTVINSRRVNNGEIGGVTGMAIDNGAVLTTGTLANPGAPQVYAAYFDTSTGSKIWRSAITPVATGNAGATNATRTGFTLGALANGAAAFMNGKIAECFIVAGAMAPADFASAMNYCGARYGIAVGP